MPNRAEVIQLHRADDVRSAADRAARCLAQGQLGAFPTETVYGLAADPNHPEAVDRLRQIKGRDAGKPLTLALDSPASALQLVPSLSPLARRLVRRCWPGPVTLVVPTGNDSLLSRLSPQVRQAVVAEDSVGLRVPAHDVIQQVVRLLRSPVALTSANLAGQPDATDAQQVLAQFGDQIEILIDDGPSRYGQPSTVVRVNSNHWRVLREGVVNGNTIRRLASCVLLFVCTGNTCRSPLAEALARKLLAEQAGCSPEELEGRGYVVMSAGIAAGLGTRPSPEAVEVAQEMAVRLDDHLSQPLTRHLLEHADLIFPMTRSQLDAILAECPDVASRTRLLSDEGDISDPIGGGIEQYRHCAREIEGHLHKLIPNLPC